MKILMIKILFAKILHLFYKIYRKMNLFMFNQMKIFMMLLQELQMKVILIIITK
jgi:hypothetical protein